MMTLAASIDRAEKKPSSYSTGVFNLAPAPSLAASLRMWIELRLLLREKAMSRHLARSVGFVSTAKENVFSRVDKCVKLIHWLLPHLNEINSRKQV